MFNKISANYFREFLTIILGFIFVFKSDADPSEATIINESNTTTEITQDTEGFWTQISLPQMGAIVGAIVTVGCVALVIYVAVSYVKREKQRVGDLESGRRKRKAENTYDSHALKSEERAPQNQAGTADQSGEDEDEDEDMMDADDGHYTRVEILSGSSKSAAKKSAEAKKSKTSTAESSKEASIFMKVPMKKEKVNGSNPLYSKVVNKNTNGTKEQSVDDLYTKVKGKKKRKESSSSDIDDLYTRPQKQQKQGASAATPESADDLYTRPQKQQKNRASSATPESADDLYTKSLKQQKHGASASASGSADDLYSKPLKKRVKHGKKDVEEMYTKSKKKVRKPFYMNSMKVEKDRRSRRSAPAEDTDETYENEKRQANDGAKGVIVQDNELYTDCPDLN